MVRLRQVSFLIQGLLCNISEGQILIDSAPFSHFSQSFSLSFCTCACLMTWTLPVRLREPEWKILSWFSHELLLSAQSALKKQMLPDSPAVHELIVVVLCVSHFMCPPPLPVKQCFLTDGEGGGHRGETVWRAEHSVINTQPSSPRKTPAGEAF